MTLGGNRKVEIAIGAKPGALFTALRGATTKLNTFGKQARGALKRTAGAFGGLGRGLNSALGGLGGPLLAVGSIGGLAAVAGETLKFEESLTRLGIAAGRTPQEMEKIRNGMMEVSNATGVSRESIVAGAADFVAATGDIDGAAANLRLFAEVARGTGTEMENVSAVAVSMAKNLKIEPGDFRKGFDVLISQGKSGAIELKQLAEEMSSLAPTFSQFQGGQGVQGLSDLGSSLQFVRQGFGSSSEAATGMAALLSAITKKAGDLEKAGVKVYQKNPRTGAKELRPFLEIVDSIGSSKLMKDPTALGRAFGRDEARRAFAQIIQNRDAVGDMATAYMESGQTAKDYASYQQSASGKISTAWNGVKNALADAFTPDRVESLASAISELPHIASAAVMMFKDIAGFLADIVDSLTAAYDLAGNIVSAPGEFLHDKLGFTSGKEVAAQQQLMFDTRGSDEEKQQRMQDALMGRPVKPHVPQQVVKVETTVKVGANSVAKASGEATSHRSRPGGN